MIVGKLNVSADTVGGEGIKTIAIHMHQKGIFQK